jgi:hypothetical protein
MTHLKFICPVLGTAKFDEGLHQKQQYSLRVRCIKGRKESKPIKPNFQESFIVQNVLHISTNICSKPKLNQSPPPPLSMIGFYIRSDRFLLYFEVCDLWRLSEKSQNKQHVLDKHILSENIIVVGSTGVYFSCSLLICLKRITN